MPSSGPTNGAGAAHKRTRDAATDPQPGDTLSLKGYRITVQERIGSLIRYSVTKKGQASRQSTQDLAEWSKWATEAKIVERAGDCAAIGFCVSGKCSACLGDLPGEVHIVDKGLYCPGCCPARKHGKVSNEKGMAA